MCHWLEELTHQQPAGGWDGLEIPWRLPGCGIHVISHITGLASSQHGDPVVHFLTTYLIWTGRRQKMPCQPSSGLDSGVWPCHSCHFLFVRASHQASPNLRKRTTDSTSWWAGVANTYREEKPYWYSFLRRSITGNSLYTFFSLSLHLTTIFKITKYEKTTIRERNREIREKGIEITESVIF